MSFLQVNGELRGGVRDRGASHIGTVYKELIERRNALEYNRILLCGLLGCHGYKFTVYAQRIVIRNVGRIHRIWVIDIGIVGFFVSCRLPAGGHRDLIPGCDFFRAVYVSGKIVEIPCSIQQFIICGSGFLAPEGFFKGIVGYVMSPRGEGVFVDEVQVFILSHMCGLLV